MTFPRSHSQEFIGSGSDLSLHAVLPQWIKVLVWGGRARDTQSVGSHIVLSTSSWHSHGDSPTLPSMSHRHADQEKKLEDGYKVGCQKGQLRNTFVPFTTSGSENNN